MKNRYLLLVLIGIIGLFSAYFFTQNRSEELKYMPREQEQQANLEMIHGAMEWVNQRLVNADGIIDPMEVGLARKQVELFRQQKAGNMNWTEMGPDNQGGRTRAILIDKDNHSTVYAGAVSGGLWKSTTGGQSWIKINDLQDNIAISCITQDPVSGAIYVGTGEGFAPGKGTANGSTGFIGGGVWKSTDGTTFTVLSSTIPTANLTNDTWSYTYEMACDANGGIYVGTQRGLQYSSDGGTTWTNPVIYPGSNPFNTVAYDVEIASDGTVFAVVGNKVFISADGSVGSFAVSTNGLPLTSGRVELAVAPSDPNYVYANIAKTGITDLGAFDGIYKTTDKGSSWTKIATGGSQNFNIFGDYNQGVYDNEIAVFPNNKDKVLIGGIDMYMGEAVGTSTSYAWTQKSLWALDPTSSLYLHADQHKYVFHPTNPNKIYFGTDGGVSISLDGGHTFQVFNRNYNTLQLYSLAVSPQGMMMGGTQDNGTQLIPLTGNTTMNAYKVSGGDGGWCAFSYLDPNILFSTVYYASLYRSPDLGANLSDFYSDALANITGQPGNAAFVPPIFLWESINDTTTSDYVSFVAEQNYNAGDYIIVNSNTASYPILHQLSSALISGDSISIKDVVQSKFYVGLNNSIWMTRKSLDFSVSQPEWYKISANTSALPDGFSGTAQCMNVSNCGNYLYVGTSAGKLYRIANLLNANDKQSADITSPYCVVETKLLKSYFRTITSIAINPNDPDHIVVTLGNYGNSSYIEESKNATDQNPTFTSKQGNLPAMPVYSSIIEMNDANKVVIGTEYGVFSTDNISASSPNWAAENANGLANVPVYFLVQQTKDWGGVSNWGSIYAATHGRGFFKSDDYLSIPSDEKPTIAINSTLNIYPNPAVTETKVAYQLYEASDVVISIYNLQGKLVFKDSYANQRAGKHSLRLDCNDFSRGTYIVRVSTAKQTANGKFIVL